MGSSWKSSSSSTSCNANYRRKMQQVKKEKENRNKFGTTRKKVTQANSRNLGKKKWKTNRNLLFAGDERRRIFGTIFRTSCCSRTPC